MAYAFASITCAMTWCSRHSGAKDLPTFQKKAKFVQITNAGLLESHPHDVMVIKDAPNYKSSK